VLDFVESLGLGIFIWWLNLQFDGELLTVIIILHCVYWFEFPMAEPGSQAHPFTQGLFFGMSASVAYGLYALAPSIF